MEIADAKEKGSISYVSIAPVRGIGWSVIVGQEKNAILKQLYGYFILSAATGFVIFLFLTVCLLYFGREYKYRKTKELQASEELYRILFNETLDGICLADAETGIIIDCNQALEALVCRERAELIGQPQTILHPPQDDKKAFSLTFKQHLTDKQGQILETQVVTKTGDIREVEIKANFVVLHGRTLLQGLFCDITDSKRAEEALRRSEENFRRSLDGSPLGVRIVTLEGETIYANQAILDVYGYDSFEELRTTPLKEHYTPESYAEFQIRREKRKQGDYLPSEYEVSIIRKDGEVRHLQVFRKEILWNGEEQFQVIYQDITERKQAEDALRKSESRLVDLTEQQKMVLDALPQLVSFIDADLIYRFVNRSYEKFFERKYEDIVGRSLLEIIGHAVWEIVEHHVRRALAGEVMVYDEKFNYPDKEPRQMMGHLIPHRGMTGSVDGYFAVLLDITERKRAEEELQASREQMRALAGRLQAVREEERTNIAREIHDELGGALTGLKIDFSLLTRAALKIENETVRTSLLAGMDSMTKLIDATIQTVRRIAMELRPGVLDDLGLVAALEWQLKDFEKRTGIRCEFFPPVEDISLDADLSTALFRIFQEALTNVARHSGGTEVRVRLRADADSSTLEVEDNGKGIEKEKTLGSKSFGLLGMRERAQMFGGRITVTGTPGIGTKVTVEIPPAEKRKMDRNHEGAAG
jgi:PAS domain S-box-containing protein